MKNAILSLRAQLKSYRQESLVETHAYDAAVSEAEIYAKQLATRKEVESREIARLQELINKQNSEAENHRKNMARLMEETGRLQAIVSAEKPEEISWVENMAWRLHNSSPKKILSSERVLLMYIASLCDIYKYDSPQPIELNYRSASAATGIAETTLKVMISKLPRTGLCSKASRGSLILKEKGCTKCT